MTLLIHIDLVFGLRGDKSNLVKGPVDGGGYVAKMGVYALEKTEIEGQCNGGSAG